MMKLISLIRICIFMILIFYRKMVILGNWVKNRKEYYFWFKDDVWFFNVIFKNKKGISMYFIFFVILFDLFVCLIY